MRAAIIVLIVCVFFGCIFTTSCFADTHLAVKGGFDFLGRGKGSIMFFNVKADVEPGVTLGLELYNDLDDNFSIGGGFEHQLERDGFYYSPILYGLVRLFIFSDLKKDIRFYLTGKSGYNSLKESDYDTSGGSYFGFGGGIVKAGKAQMEFLYSIHNGAFEEYDNGHNLLIDMRYTKFSISLSRIF